MIVPFPYKPLLLKKNAAQLDYLITYLSCLRIQLRGIQHLRCTKAPLNTLVSIDLADPRCFLTKVLPPALGPLTSGRHATATKWFSRLVVSISEAQWGLPRWGHWTQPSFRHDWVDQVGECSVSTHVNLSWFIPECKDTSSGPGHSRYDAISIAIWLENMCKSTNQKTLLKTTKQLAMATLRQPRAMITSV